MKSENELKVAGGIESVDFDRLKSILNDSKSMLLISHVRPDGDAIGSQIALGRALADLGKDVHMVNSDPVSPNLTFLDPEERIRALDSLSPAEKEALNHLDLLISLDTSSWAQLGKMADVVREFPGRKIVIDHHEKGNDIGAERFVDPQAAATGSLIFNTIRALGLTMKKEYADPIFAAISTDTGWFRFSNVQPETFQMAADLESAGTDPADIYKIVYERESLGRIRLVGAALVKAETFLDGRGIFTSLTLNDFDRAGAQPFESEDIVNMTLTVADTEVAVIMVEQRSGGYKLSFRSRCDLDCSLLAARFGGGGHKKAAGASIDLPYEESKKKIIDTILEFTK